MIGLMGLHASVGHFRPCFEDCGITDKKTGSGEMLQSMPEYRIVNTNSI